MFFMSIGNGVRIELMFNPGTYGLRWHDPTYYFARISLIFYMMRIRALHLHNKKKGYVTILLFQNLALK